MTIESLYTPILVEAARDTAHEGKPEDTGAYLTATAHNPVCGDKITWYVKMHGDIITDARYEATGCMICRASAAMLAKWMQHESKTRFSESLEELLRALDPALPPPDKTALQEKNWLALAQMKAYAARKKCAILAWEGFQKALERKPTKSR